jgi:hypothetical protein
MWQNSEMWEQITILFSVNLFFGLCPSSIFKKFKIKNLQRFGSWIFFRLQVKRTGQKP